MSTPTLTPAYGRDYKSKKAAIEDFEANKDFIFNCMFGPDACYDGKPVNKEQLVGKYKAVQLRYGKLRKVTIHKIA